MLRHSGLSNMVALGTRLAAESVWRHTFVSGDKQVSVPEK